MSIRPSIKETGKIVSLHGDKYLGKKNIASYPWRKWICERGHIPKSPYFAGFIMRGERCRQCLREDAVDSWRTRICERGHVPRSPFQADYIRRGERCRICIREDYQKKYFEKLQTLAKQKGGKLLSQVYGIASQKLKWKCSKGHEWLALPQVILRGSWCRKCASRIRGETQRRNAIQKLKEIAKSHGGKLLSIHYQDMFTRLKWQCRKKHTWYLSAVHVVSNKIWCRKCYAEARKLSAKAEYQRIAQKRGGSLLSKKYVNVITPLRWQCAKGHIWKANPLNIKFGHTWCPECFVLRLRLPYKRKHYNYTAGEG